MKKEKMKKTKKLSHSTESSQLLTLAGVKFDQPIPCYCGYVCFCDDMLSDEMDSGIMDLRVDFNV